MGLKLTAFGHSGSSPDGATSSSQLGRYEARSPAGVRRARFFAAPQIWMARFNFLGGFSENPRELGSLPKTLASLESLRSRGAALESLRSRGALLLRLRSSRFALGGRSCCACARVASLSGGALAALALGGCALAALALWVSGWCGRGVCLCVGLGRWLLGARPMMAASLVASGLLCSRSRRRLRRLERRLWLRSRCSTVARGCS